MTDEAAFAPFAAELAELTPAEAAPIDAHTHLGADEDGMSLDPERLIAYLDEIGPSARACVFPLHDPERRPAYRRPNDRVLAWARESGGRLIGYCRLDPAEEPVAEAERCLALGARGIKLHPRAQAFAFGEPAAEAIFAVARDAGVPILIHAGTGMDTMAPLAALALRYPDVGLVLAHAGIADQGLLASRLAGHPRVVYDTACFSATDVVQLFARVPAERIVFASDVPYGRPAGGLYLALRAAAYAGLDAGERARVAGGTMAALLDGRPLAPARPPRLASTRAVDGRLLRISVYLLAAFAAAITPPPPDPQRATRWIQISRAACRDPDPGAVGPALEHIDAALAGAERLIASGGPEAFMAVGLVMAAGAVAATS
ncbi:MAG: amidohydrolase family protein [Solirubrobacteraceae bacterium]